MDYSKKEFEKLNFSDGLEYFKNTINLTTSGKNNLTGKYIICANHNSHVDPILIMLGLMKLGINIDDLEALASIETVEKYNNFSKGFKHILVDRKHNPLQAIKDVEEKLQGKIIIFPEGTRSKTGKLGKLKSGAGQISCDLNIPILPVYIKGSFEYWSTFDDMPTKNNNIIIEFLEPIYPKDKNRKIITKELENILKNRENFYS